MKIKDFAKVSDFGSELEVIIIEEYKAWGCDGSGEALESCSEASDGNCLEGCGDCEYYSYKERYKETYEGSADDIPLRLSDKTIKKINLKHECRNAYSKKCSYNVYLYIFVKGEDEP